MRTQNENSLNISSVERSKLVNTLTENNTDPQNGEMNTQRNVENNDPDEWYNESAI
jgi:hypothetical protein